MTRVLPLDSAAAGGNRPSGTTQRSGPSKAQWEFHRAQITRLYRDEDLKLKEVMTIMKQEGFVATERMYKDRMKKWGLAKNIKEHEAIAILRIKSERDAQGKTTSIKMYNQTVDLDRFLRHAKRKRLQSFEGEVESLPSYISCKTPPPERVPDTSFDESWFALGNQDEISTTSVSSSSSSTAPTPPLSEVDSDDIDSEWRNMPTTLFDDEFPHIEQRMSVLSSSVPKLCRSPTPSKTLYIPEQLFRTITTHYATSFVNGHWINGRGDNDALCKVSSLPDPDRRNEFLGYCYMAADLRARGSLVEFRRVVSKAFGLVENIIRSNHPRTLDRLFESFLCLMHNGLLEVAMLLRDYIRDLASHMSSTVQPWVQIFRLIGTLDDCSLEHVIPRSWQCNNDALDDGLGQFSDLGLLARLNHIGSVHGSSDSQEEERILRELMHHCETSSPKPEEQIPTIMFSLGLSMMSQGRYLEAEKLGLSIVSRARKESRITLNSRVDAMVLTARAQHHQHKMELAESNIRGAICLLVDEWGKTGPLAIQYMNTLEGWLREWGRERDADDLKVAVDLVIGLDETDMEQNWVP
ncbi:hypothetical protein BKA64DRAFT_737571 [Cadophora sp. MPI-SDFR-AT-0126]|nr:hypothetical protein BKA64DRAFT_737571 [Leotiomycetes sp. MPI-SDFR-AT-0126]